MANFLKENQFEIKIVATKEKEKCVFYVIEIKIGEVWFQVERRYREFSALHQVLVADNGVASDLLPPKKFVGNKDKMFIEKRKTGLEIYLQTVVALLQKTMPNQISNFLGFQFYDVNFIVKRLARLFFHSGEAILSKCKKYAFTPLEIYSIGERLKQPCTSLDMTNQEEDFSHVLDFCCQLTEVVIEGKETALPNTSITPNTLPLHLAIFKNLNHLHLTKVNCSQITDLGQLRQTLRELTVNDCLINMLVDLFFCDQTHKTDFSPQNHWVSLIRVSISKTNVKSLDESTKVLPNLKILLLNDNNVDDISNLSQLHTLSHLSLKNNLLNLTHMLDLTKLVFLDLSENKISTLRPFSNLTSLETLNLQMNRVTDVNEVQHVAILQCLENLILTGNPVSQIVDYRVKVLQFFGNRAFRICLDNESTDQKELDRVAMLKALHATSQNFNNSTQMSMY